MPTLSEKIAVAEATELFNMGYQCELAEDYPSMVEYYKAAAEKNHTKALFKMGRLYDWSSDRTYVVSNNIKSLEYYKKTIEQFNLYRAEQDGISIFNVATLYEKGKGVEKDLDKAYAYYQEAADHRVTKAILRLKELGHKPRHLIADFNKIKDNPDALFALGQQFETDNNFPAMLTCYEAAAQQDHPRSLWRMGSFYVEESNYGVRADKDRALAFFDRAVDLGGLTPNMMGIIYYHHKNYKEALKYFTEGKKTQDPRSIFHIGNFYEGGMGVEKDTEKACEYYQEAAKIKYTAEIGKCLKVLGRKPMYKIPGFAEAENDAEKLFNLGYQFEMQHAYASMVTCFEAAAKQNHPKALRAMGNIYNGDRPYGVEADKVRSHAFYQKAILAGDKIAYLCLGNSLYLSDEYGKSLTVLQSAMKHGLDARKTALANYFKQNKIAQTAKHLRHLLHDGLDLTQYLIHSKLLDVLPIGNQHIIIAIAAIETLLTQGNFANVDGACQNLFSQLNQKSSRDDSFYKSYVEGLSFIAAKDLPRAILAFQKAKAGDEVLALRSSLWVARIYADIPDCIDIATDEYAAAFKNAADFMMIQNDIMARLRKLAEAHPENESVITTLASLYLARGDALLVLGERQEAEDDYKKSYSYIKPIKEKHFQLSCKIIFHYAQLFAKEKETSQNAYAMFVKLASLQYLDAELIIANAVLNGKYAEVPNISKALEKYEIALTHALDAHNLNAIQFIVDDLIPVSAMNARFAKKIEILFDKLLSAAFITQTPERAVSILKQTSLLDMTALKAKAENLLAEVADKEWQIVQIEKSKLPSSSPSGVNLDASLALTGNAEAIKKLAKTYQSKREYGKAMLFYSLSAIFNSEEKDEFKEQLKKIAPKKLLLFSDENLNIMQSFLLDSLIAEDGVNSLMKIKTEYKTCDPIVILLLALDHAVEMHVPAGIGDSSGRDPGLLITRARILQSIQSLLSEDLKMTNSEIDIFMERKKTAAAKFRASERNVEHPKNILTASVPSVVHASAVSSPENPSRSSLKFFEDAIKSPEAKPKIIPRRQTASLVLN